MKKVIVIICIAIFIMVTINRILSLFHVEGQNKMHSLDRLVTIHKDASEYSNEGGDIKAIYVNGTIKELCVMLYGETFRTNIEYSFFEDYIYISRTQVEYIGSITYYPEIDPYWDVDPKMPVIKNVEHGRYILVNDILYDYNIHSEEMIPLPDDRKEVIESQLESFLSNLN